MTNNYRQMFAACNQTQSGASGPALRRPAVQCESESLLNTTEELQVALRYLTH
jgi:hypothetical protein